MILLDTHVLLWLAEAHPNLGQRTTRLANTALQRDEARVSAISFWEIGMLVAKGRVRGEISAPALRRKTLEQGVQEVPLTGTIGIAAAELRDFHGDPADRMIIATALSIDAELLTADEGILGWSGGLRAVDARR